MAYAIFEVFPAVYRAPYLFGTVPVMNSRRFAEIPAPCDADIFASPFRVSLMWGLPPRPFEGSLPEKGASGGGIFRFYRGLPSGPGVFLPLGNRFPIFPLPSRFHRAAVSTPPGHRLSVSPFLRPLSLAEGRIEGVLFPDFVSGGWPLPRQGVALLPWMVSPGSSGSSHRPRVLPGLPGGGGFPPGCCPRRYFASWQVRFPDRIFFPVYWAGLFPFPRRGSPKRVPSCLRMFLFQGFPQPPFSHLHGRPGSSSAVAFLTPRRGALATGSSPSFRSGFAVALPSCGLPQGGAFLDDLSSR